MTAPVLSHKPELISLNKWNAGAQRDYDVPSPPLGAGTDYEGNEDLEQNHGITWTCMPKTSDSLIARAVVCGG